MHCTNNLILGCRNDKQRSSAQRALNNKTFPAKLSRILKSFTLVIG